MPFKVEDFHTLFTDAQRAEGIDTQQLQDALNAFEADGYKLVKIIDQHRQWTENSEVGGLWGPFFVFHTD